MLRSFPRGNQFPEEKLADSVLQGLIAGNVQASSLAAFGASKLYYSVTLSHFHIVTLSHCHFVILYYCHILSYCHIVTLSHCPIVQLSNCQIVTLSHCGIIRL